MTQLVFADPAPPDRRLATLRSIAALMLREMATTYGRSPGGYLWAVLEPVGGIAVLTAVFSMALHRPALGTNFPLFYATAYLPFMLYSGLSVRVAQAIQYSRPLFAYASVTHVDAILARFLLALLTQAAVFAIVIAGIHVAYGLRPVFDPPGVLLAFAMAAALGLGLGTFNCTIRTRFPVWDQVWSILNRPIFLISGVFFLYEGLPPAARDWLWFNPVLHVTGAMRHAFYPGYPAAYVSPTYVFGLALGFTATGLLMLGRWHRDLLND